MKEIFLLVVSVTFYAPAIKKIDRVFGRYKSLSDKATALVRESTNYYV